MNIGTMILNLRKQKNITQEALAAELGVTAAAVSKWENGYTLPDVLMLCALVSVHPTDAEILDAFRIIFDQYLDPSDRQFIVN